LPLETDGDAVAQRLGAAEVVARDPDDVPPVIEQDLVAADVCPPPLLGGAVHVALVLDRELEHDGTEIRPAYPAATLVVDIEAGFRAWQTSVDDDQTNDRLGWESTRRGTSAAASRDRTTPRRLRVAALATCIPSTVVSPPFTMSSPAITS
jgi:hypothetical protein